MSANAYYSLVNATTGKGTIVDFGQTVRNITFEVVANGTIAGGTVQMTISEDGVTFFSPPAAAFTNMSGATLANPYVLVTGTNGLFTLGTGMAIRYAQAAIGTNVTGGGSATCLISGV